MDNRNFTDTAAQSGHGGPTRPSPAEKMRVQWLGESLNRSFAAVPNQPSPMFDELLRALG